MSSNSTKIKDAHLQYDEDPKHCTKFEICSFNTLLDSHYTKWVTLGMTYKTNGQTDGVKGLLDLLCNFLNELLKIPCQQVNYQ